MQMNEIRIRAVQPTTSGHRVDLLPGVMWFILADIILFCLIFADFMMQRAGQLAVFNQSAATLDVQLGVLNTLILITSGLFVVFAVNAAKAGNRGSTRRWLLLSFVVGAGFAVTKVSEYSGKLGQGITMYTNDFYMYYFTLTGAHFVHFIGGMVTLAVLWFLVGRQHINGRLLNVIEAGALYWHMVDLLWIFLFPMLYLLGAR